MKEKRKSCLYCGKEMKEVKTVRKKFCSDLCRVNFNNEVKYEKDIREILDKPIFNKLKKDILFNMIVYGSSTISEQQLKDISKNASVDAEQNEDFKNEVYKVNEPKKLKGTPPIWDRVEKWDVFVARKNKWYENNNQ